MSENQITTSESEGSGSEKHLSSEEDGEEEARSNAAQQMSDYEKQRLARIAENRARMEALGLSKMAASLMGSSRNSSRSSIKHKGKRKVVDEDEDYRPDDDDHERDDAELDGGDDEDDDEEEDFWAGKGSRSQKTKLKNKGSKQKKIPPVKKHLSSSDYVEDDEDLLKAIALSLQDVGKDSGAVRRNAPESTYSEKKGNVRIKRKKSFTSRQQMTEDEIIMHFFQFDEAGKGGITVRDLQKVAVAHDFVWTDKEVTDMIRCFDTDGDGKLSLDDFRKIVSRCNMLQMPENL